MAGRYLDRRAAIPWWAESERALAEHLPGRVGRFLDLGTGDGRLIELVRRIRPDAEAVGLDQSPPILDAAARRLAGRAELVRHDMAIPLPPLGTFDLVVSAFAIHHLGHARTSSTPACAPSVARCRACCTPGAASSSWSTSPRRPRAFTPSSSRRSARIPATRTRPTGWRPPGPWPSGSARPASPTPTANWKWRELALVGGRRP